MDTTSTANGITLGLDTFGDVTDGDDGRPLTHAQTISNLVHEGVLADQGSGASTTYSATPACSRFRSRRRVRGLAIARAVPQLARSPGARHRAARPAQRPLDDG
jgi:hypothetical protein